MKKCLLCGTESSGETCPACGEASWSESVELALSEAIVEARTVNNQKKISKKRPN